LHFFAFAVVAFMPQQVPAPSQWELNGFILGQHISTIEATFGEPADVQKSPDGWVDRAYYTDTTETAYMAFGFTPDRPDYIYAIQLTGRPRPDHLPFLGLELGMPADTVVHCLGPASHRVTIPYRGAERWEFDGRDYSAEVDTAGVLLSIRLHGYEGFSDQPDSIGDLLGRFHAALQSSDVDQLIASLAPDFEIYRGTEVIRYTGPARHELADHESRVWRALVTDSMSVRRALAAVDTADIETNLRLHERGPLGFVFKFPDYSDLSEIVLISYAGRWVAWEIAFR